MGMLKELIQGAKDIIQKPSPLDLELRSLMAQHNVNRVQDIPRDARSNIAKDLFFIHTQVAGESQYTGKGDVSLGLWFNVSNTLGPDTLIDVVQAGLASQRMIADADIHVPSEIERVTKLAIEQGWRQE